MRVYASVCWILTAITSDTKRLFSEGFAPFHVVMASLRRPRGPLLCAALSHDSCNIYMFTLTISICCFWNNQQQRPGEKRGELLQSRTQLGFHDWEAGPDYARLGRERGKEGRGFHFLSLQGPLKVPDGGALGVCASSSARGKWLHWAEISHCGPCNPAHLGPGWGQGTNGFQICYKINRMVQLWSKTF